MSNTDEIFETATLGTEDVRESNGDISAENGWSQKLQVFAPDSDKYNQPFTRTELGDGQVMSKAESSRLIAQHGLRENAGAAANAALSADLEWADVRIKEQRLVGKQLERGIYQAKNVQLGNELLYQVGRIPLHAEKRHLQLQQLSNQVKGLRESVKISATRLTIESVESDGIEVDFSSIEIEE